MNHPSEVLKYRHTNPDYTYETVEIAYDTKLLNRIDGLYEQRGFRRVWSDTTPTGIFAVYCKAGG